MLRSAQIKFTKILTKQKQSLHRGLFVFKDDDEKKEKFEAQEVIQKKNSVFKKNKYETKDGEIEETHFKYTHPKKDEAFESQTKKISTEVAGTKLENITEKKYSIRKKSEDSIEHTDEFKVKSQTKRATSPERTTPKFGILKKEEKLEKIQRTQTTVSPQDKTDSYKKRGTIIKHAPEVDYSSRKVEKGKVLSELKENYKTEKSVVKVENQKVIRKHDTIINKKTFTMETKSPKTLEESEFRRMVTSNGGQKTIHSPEDIQKAIDKEKAEKRSIELKSKNASKTSTVKIERPTVAKPSQQPVQKRPQISTQQTPVSSTTQKSDSQRRPERSTSPTPDGNQKAPFKSQDSSTSKTDAKGKEKTFTAGNKISSRLIIPPEEVLAEVETVIADPDVIEIDEDDDYNQSIQMKRAIEKEKAEKRALREQRLKNQKKTSQRRLSRINRSTKEKEIDQDLDYRDTDTQFAYEDDADVGNDDNDSAFVDDDNDDPTRIVDPTITQNYFDDDNTRKIQKTKLNVMVKRSMEVVASKIISIINETNEAKKKELQKLQQRVQKGEITQTYAALIKNANVELYTLSNVPVFNFKPEDSVANVLHQMVEQYEAISHRHRTTMEDIEKLNAFELSELEKDGKLTKETIDSYVDDTPMSAIIDQVYRDLEYKMYFDEMEISADSVRDILDGIMNHYFVGRGSAVSKYLKKEGEEENKASHWNQWLNEDQKKELAIAVISKIHQLTSHLKPHIVQKTIMKSFGFDDEFHIEESSPDTKGTFNIKELNMDKFTPDQRKLLKELDKELNEDEDVEEDGGFDNDEEDIYVRPSELENHVIVREKRLLHQIAAFRHHILETQIDQPKIEDIKAYRIAGKFGKNKVMVPFDRYYSRYIDELKDGSYAKQRFIQQCRSVAKNTTMSLQQKHYYIKMMFNTYKQMDLCNQGEREPYVKPTIMSKYLPSHSMELDKRSKFILDYVAQQRKKHKIKRDQKRQLKLPNE